MTPLSLYVHIPFCRSKCNYCDFVSGAANSSVIDHYLDCLLIELELNRETINRFKVDTVFVGGGTPSILSPAQLTKLLTAIKERIPLSEVLEFTFECNPESVTFEKLQILKTFGVNRISLGLQSANDDELLFLGRVHSFSQFLEAFTLAKNVGFKTINVDLMFAFPGQTMESFSRSLDLVTCLAPSHIACYSLIIEEGTPIAKALACGSIEEPSEEDYINMYRFAISNLEEKGYRQYEISNFAKKNCQSTHNIGYWTHKNYLGLGVAAHSFIDNRRFSNTEDLDNYIKLIENGIIPLDYEECLKTSDRFDEVIMLGLRMNDGIELNSLFQEFDLGKDFSDRIQTLKEQGLLEFSSSYLKLTQLGREMCNTVILELVK